MGQVKYALKHKETGKLVGFTTSSNRDLVGFTTSSNRDGEFCCDTQHILSENEKNVWTVDTPEHAEWVRQNSTEWYNAHYDTPTHYYKTDDVVVVKVETIVVEEELEVEIPTFEEFARWFSKGDEQDYKFYMLQKKENPGLSYDLYHLQEMLRKDPEKFKSGCL